jgi:16S rRNA (guanine(966)-N(2))-methyltransferase RsmD
MRVISGVCRGRLLSAPSGLITRPTSDRVKESLFNILSSRIDFSGIRVLDICAGSGSLGIEALSRGAETCCFIESNLSVIPILQKNLQVTGFKTCCEILVMDAVKALHHSVTRGKSFDLVFFDPPYSSELYLHVPDILSSSGLMTAGSILVVESLARKPLPESYKSLVHCDRRIYGETALDLFSPEEK